MSTPDGKPPSAMLQTTSWTLVTNAAHRDTPVGQRALNELCERYWPPIYAYIRRRGYDATGAADLTQDFFARLMHREDLVKLDPARREQGSRFRGFLKVSVDSMLKDQARKASREERAGEQGLQSFDPEQAEQSLAFSDPAASPEAVLELSWAMVIKQRACERLEAKYTDDPIRKARWDLLARYVLAEPDPGDYERAAAKLDIRVTAAKVAVNRMRKKLRDFAREETADTVTRQELLAAEMGSLTASWPALQ